MKLPRERRWRHSERGQGLVEFAILLPLLVLLLVMAVDFGRVFFGWVALHNAARIGADYAAGNADAWDGMLAPYQSTRDRYEELVLNDLQSLNCTLPSPDPVTEPVFSGFADGDLVQVQLDCSFGLITPLAEAVLGGPVDMTVRTDFAIYRTRGSGLTDGGGEDEPPPPPPPCTAPDALISTAPAESGGRVTINTGQNVTFTDDSSVGEDCDITAWLWDFGDGTPTVDTQGPHTRSFTNPGPPTNKDYTVTLTVTNAYGQDTDSVVVRVKK